MLRAYNAAGVQVATKSQPGASNGPVYSELRVDACDAANLIWKVVVDIRQDASASCCNAGPEYVDFLSFDPVYTAAPVSSASVSPLPHADGRNDAGVTVARSDSEDTPAPAAAGRFFTASAARLLRWR